MTHPTSLYIGNTEFHARRENVPNSNPETTTQFTHVYDMRHLPIVEVGEPIALNGVFLVTSDDGTLLSSPTSRMNFHAVWEDGSTLTRIQLELNGLKFRTPADFLQANPEIRRIPTFQRAMEAGRWYIHRGWEISATCIFTIEYIPDTDVDEYYVPGSRRPVRGAVSTDREILSDRRAAVRSVVEDLIRSGQ